MKKHAAALSALAALSLFPSRSEAPQRDLDTVADDLATGKIEKHPIRRDLKPPQDEGPNPLKEFIRQWREENPFVDLPEGEWSDDTINQALAECASVGERFCYPPHMGKYYTTCTGQEEGSGGMTYSTRWQSNGLFVVSLSSGLNFVETEQEYEIDPEDPNAQEVLNDLCAILRERGDEATEDPRLAEKLDQQRDIYQQVQAFHTAYEDHPYYERVSDYRVRIHDADQPAFFREYVFGESVKGEAVAFEQFPVNNDLPRKPDFFALLSQHPTLELLGSVLDELE